MVGVGLTAQEETWKKKSCVINKLYYCYNSYIVYSLTLVLVYYNYYDSFIICYRYYYSVAICVASYSKHRFTFYSSIATLRLSVLNYTDIS